MNKISIEEIQTLTKTERRIYTALSKASFTVPELSFMFECKETTIRDHLQSLREKGYISDRVILNDNPRKVYFCKELEA